MKLNQKLKVCLQGDIVSPTLFISALENIFFD